MEREIIVNVAPHETRVAVIENHKLVQVLVERPESERLVGNIYLGKVSNVLAGIQSAFIDIGMERAAFLSASDIQSDYMRLAGECMGDDADSVKCGERKEKRIEKLFKVNQSVIVQVVKEPIGTKGARVTTQISLAGRFLVLMAGEKFLGVSKKIPDRVERVRLREIVKKLTSADAGFIIRTASDGASESAIMADAKDLLDKWNAIKKDASRMKAPSLLLAERDMVSAAVRDYFNGDSLRCVVDNKRVHEAIVGYIRQHHPHLAERVYYFSEKAPIFEVFGVEKDIEKGLRRKVWLKHGGSLVFDHTEAMTVIDVNTGRNIGKKDAEETLLKNNLEAADEIARQLRLRDIGGIVAIDFVDMKRAENRKRLLDALRLALKKDPTPNNLGGIGDFGIVLLTRKREGKNLHAVSTELCESCGGSGRIFSKSTVLAKLDRQLYKIRSALGIKKVILNVNPGFAHYLREEKEKRIKEIQRAANVKIIIEESLSMAMDAFEIWNMERSEEYTGLLQPVLND